MEQDPLASFLSSLTQKMRVESEHSVMMEKLNNPDTPINTNINPLEIALAKLQGKVAQVTIPRATEEKSIPVVDVTLEDDSVEPLKEESFVNFIDKLKDIIVNPPVKKHIEEIITIQEDLPKSVIEPVSSAPKVKVTTPNAYIEQLDRNNAKPVIVDSNDYTKELDKLSTSIAGEHSPEKLSQITKLLEEYIDKRLKKVAVMAEYAGGGGSVAVQYAKGGTMNGDLNVTGQYLSAGVNINTLFGTGGSQGDVAVDSLVHTNSGKWETGYTAFTILTANSANWNTAYNVSTSYQNISGSFATLDFVGNNFFNLTGGIISGATRINNNLTVFGNLTATGTTTFANTVFSVTSALSVVHVGSGPALYVGNNGDGDIASFYDLDQGIEVFHVGGNNGSFPNVRITHSGGWDRDNMSTKVFKTFLDGLDYNGQMLNFGTNLNIEDIIVSRFYSGISVGMGSFVNNCDGYFCANQAIGCLGSSVIFSNCRLSSATFNTARSFQISAVNMYFDGHQLNSTGTCNIILNNSGGRNLENIRFHYCGNTPNNHCITETDGGGENTIKNVTCINSNKFYFTNGLNEPPTTTTIYNLSSNSTQTLANYTNNSQTFGTYGSFNIHGYNGDINDIRSFGNRWTVLSERAIRNQSQGLAWKITTPVFTQYPLIFPIRYKVATVAARANVPIKVTAYIYSTKTQVQGLSAGLMCANDIAVNISETRAYVNNTSALTYIPVTWTFTPTADSVIPVYFFATLPSNTDYAIIDSVSIQ